MIACPGKSQGPAPETWVGWPRVPNGDADQSGNHRHERGNNHYRPSIKVHRTTFSLVYAENNLRGAGRYFTSALELVAKFSSKEGKTPRISVPSAAAHSVVLMPALSGSSVSVDSPGSCIYITTRMRR